MEALAVAGIIGLLVFWKNSPLKGILGGFGHKQLSGGNTNNTPGTAPGAVSIKAPGDGGGIGTRAPANPPPDGLGIAVSLLGSLGNAVRGIAGSGSLGGSPYGSSSSAPPAYPDGTVGPGPVGTDTTNTDPNFPGNDPSGNYQPGIGGANADPSFNDGTVMGGDGQSDPWGNSAPVQPLDPYNTSNADVGGGVDTSNFDGTIQGY